MSDIHNNNIYPNNFQDIPYMGLLQEKIVFDFRRGLPVFLDFGAGYFLKPYEFLADNTHKNTVIIKGDTQGNSVIENDTDNLWADYGNALLAMIKMSELSPALCVYPCDDINLKKIVTHINIQDLQTFCQIEYHIEKIIQTPLPTVYSSECTLIAYRVIPSFYEYYAIIVGNPDTTKTVDIRLHAECLTGDLLGSLRCDCQPQLHKALCDFSNNHGGVIIYIRQEGRNIGLMNKVRAYDLQNKGHDTVDANLLLGFMIDERDYQAASMILKDLKINAVNVLTNNPEKIAALAKYNIHVDNRIAHYTQTQQYNEHYIHTKKHKIGHLPEE